MVAENKTDRKLLKKVAEVYNWLDLEIRNNDNLAGVCEACGRCCNFAEFGHHLFVTTAELASLAANSKGGQLKSMHGGLCPYNINSKCSVYEHRFAACRIFCCKGDKDFQSRLSEAALEEFKSICDEFKIRYLYSDITTALK